MTVRDEAIAKLHKLPEGLVQDVNDYMDFLLMKSDNSRWQLWSQFAESQALAEADMSDYLANLEAYEEALASGKIGW